MGDEHYPEITLYEKKDDFKNKDDLKIKTI